MAPFFPNSLFGARAIAPWTAFFAFAVVLFVPGVLNDGDTYWHIAAGRWMIDNRAVLHIDPFSYTFAGHSWQTHEWLSEIVMALAYVGLGWNGILILFAGAFALTAGLLARHLTQWLGGISLIATLVFSLACVAGSLLTRPHLLALPLLEIWTAGLVFARFEGRAPSWKLLPVMALWANLHASFLLGFALAIPFALEAVLESDARVQTAKRWGIFLVLALLASLLTPYGIHGLIFPFKLLAMPSLQLLSEWQPTNLREFQPLLAAVAAALYVLLARGAKVKPLRIVLLLGLLYLALIHVRHHMLLAIAGPLILAEPLARALGQFPRGATSSEPVAPRRAFAAVFVFILFFASAGGFRLSLPFERGDDIATPASAFAHVPESLRHAPVLNDYAFGGYLIFNDVRPFIDSRAELYGEKFLSLYVRMLHPESHTLAVTLAQYRVSWTIFAADSPAVGIMDGMTGWRRVYADRWAVVHVKDSTP